MSRRIELNLQVACSLHLCRSSQCLSGGFSMLETDGMAPCPFLRSSPTSSSCALHEIELASLLIFAVAVRSGISCRDEAVTNTSLHMSRTAHGSQQKLGWLVISTPASPPRNHLQSPGTAPMRLSAWGLDKVVSHSLRPLRRLRLVAAVAVLFLLLSCAVGCSFLWPATRSLHVKVMV